MWVCLCGVDVCVSVGVKVCGVGVSGVCEGVWVCLCV